MYGAFYGCNNITSITLGDGISTISKKAFYKCSNLTSITIPNSVTSVPYGAFNECNNLKTVYYVGTESAWSEISIGTFNGALTEATCYYYSATQPTTTGNYWHYVDGVPTKW